jgi:hypothetical protein
MNNFKKCKYKENQTKKNRKKKQKQKPEQGYRWSFLNICEHRMVNSPISCCLNTLPQNQSIYSRREKSGRGGSGLYLAKGPRTGLSTFWVLK